MPDATVRTPGLADELVAKHVEPDRKRSGRHNARLVGGPAVWAIIGYLRGADVAETARAYAVPEEAVRAAIAYYQRHREYIDAKLLLNDESFA
jgi:hypothetical protein